MRTCKLFTLFVVLVLAASCHTWRKGHKDDAYTSLHKELKKELPDAKVVKMKDSVKVIYTEVYMFDFGKDEIKLSALASFQRFAAVLKRENQVYCIINGYTDNVGPDDVNNSLSLRRANNSKALLVSNGVDAPRLTANGMGSSNPIMSNTTDEGRASNRRVEFVLYKNCK